MEQKSNTKRLVVLAFLIALEIILTRFLLDLRHRSCGSDSDFCRSL